VSLSADPVEEVKVGFEMLKSLGLRRRGVTVISCPSCARQQFEVIKTVERLEERLAHITTPLTLSVIGCVVNGPGEARETDIGLTGGGNGTHQIYIGGLTHHRLKDADIVDHLVELVEKKVAELEAARRAASEFEVEPAKRARPGTSGGGEPRGSRLAAEQMDGDEHDQSQSDERCDRQPPSLGEITRIEEQQQR
jgi:(E)-4-hydroxy-3-methylbut-2-enyl-diphosphate synthase